MDLRTGRPFWPIRDGLLHSYPTLRSSVTTEVAVLGAGITGALVAHALTGAGVSVVVVDERDVGMGSSAASTGLLQYATDTSLEELIAAVGEEQAVLAYRAGLQAVEDLDDLTRSFADRCGFSRRSSLYLASNDEATEDLIREHALRAKHGFDVELWDQASVERRSSFTAPAGLYCRGDGEVDCYRLVHATLWTSVNAGARVFDRTRVTGIARDASGVVMETGEGHHVRARRLVVAAGYEASGYLGRKTGELSSTWACVSEPVEAFTGWPERCLIWETARPYLYLRTTDDGRIVVGGEDEPWSKRHQSTSALVKKGDKLADRVRAMFPDIPFDIAYRWAGVFGSTADGLPFIGAVPECPHTWFALGYGGNGITFSMIAAAILREAWFDRVHPAAHVFAFDRPPVSRRGWFGRQPSASR